MVFCGKVVDGNQISKTDQQSDNDVHALNLDQ